ncbi:HlyD family efflux transporter periplasmic adaptor subunit [Nodularia sp. UHCC 0506]|uniref:HlyD family efflux transporter periplasmic adaptor subunit n=1 Tax=Nodularia sp. UHCC 0506 TaxID=3110243 RepID=UPI002B205C2C|nr:HlyD family efflux transporter periplasmic adaptor subunit [Nodularia sp. UHCC 0506]MEA5516744.1 HlyD family efflux transporter periplasmic adaptor subunit [Nodularia sp. UHCC 0506]
MPHTLNSNGSQPINLEEHSKEELFAQHLTATQTYNNEQPNGPDGWSNSTQELLDTLPQIWTRGLLYFLVVFIAIVLPWAIFYKVDETGTARGKLEPKGDTIKREADIQASVLKVHVKQGDNVKYGQILMELDDKPVRDEIQQNQIKLEGQENRLNQLELLKNQLSIPINAQQQQNKSEELKQLNLVAQAKQNIDSLQTLYNLQKEEKLAQVRQAQQSVESSQNAYNLAKIRLDDAQNRVKRYHQLYKEGAIAQDRFQEIEGLAKDKLELQKQADSNFKQAKIRLQEQQESYRKTIHQILSDIKQANLRLKEQEQGYQSLVQGGKITVARTEQQLNELKTQITTLKSEIVQTKTQIKSLNQQLDKYTIRATYDGTIFQLPIPREGAVVQPKQLLAEIAPNGTRLVFKGEIPSSESESLRREENKQKDVNLKFDEYPFQDYEVVKGKLTLVSPSSKVTQTPQGNIVTYDIEVELAQDCVQPQGRCYPFKPGQPATAEVIIRQRRIIDFILDPFKKLQKGELKLR